jgi:hypothetical protein
MEMGVVCVALTATAAALASAVPASALIVTGGGSPSTDYLVVFDVDANYPPGAPSQVRCVDGNSACDDDRTVDGICSLRIKVCANSTVSGACSASGVSQINVDHSFDTGDDPKFDPDFLALRQEIDMDFTFPVTAGDACTGTVIVKVPIRGPYGNDHCGRGRKTLELHSVQTGAAAVIDTDALKLFCDPAPGCGAKKLYHSTFDRIQKQIFNQNCALSGCHDSQSQSGGLLLETGASWNNLVGAPPGHLPQNMVARNAGWLRVHVLAANLSGDPSTSFLYHKIEGDLPNVDYGLRMPRNRPKLKGILRNIIRLWIEGGAPDDTPEQIWVPGTF